MQSPTADGIDLRADDGRAREDGARGIGGTASDPLRQWPPSEALRPGRQDTLATRAFILVLLIAFYYLAYRYPFQISSANTSPTYSDTPTSLQMGKFALMLAVLCWVLAVAASMRARPRAVASEVWGAGVALLLLGLFATGKGVLMGIPDVMAFGFGLLVATALFGLALKRGLDPVRLSHVWSVFAVVSLLTIAVQWILFLTINRLPALAYAGSVSVRFGGVWDDPNGYAVLVAALAPAVLFGWQRHRVLRVVVGVALLASLALSQSLTGISSALVALLVGYAALRWPTSPGRVLLILGGLGSALYLTWLSVRDLPYVKEVLASKTGSFSTHAESADALGNQGPDALLGAVASPGILSESAYVWLFQTVGIPFTAVYVALGIAALVRLWRRIVAAPGAPGAAVWYASFFFCLAYLIGMVNLTLTAAFPADLLYALSIVVAFCEDGGRPVAREPSSRSLLRHRPAFARSFAHHRKRSAVEGKRLLAAVRAAWRLPLVTAVLGAVVALGVTQVQTPLYTSSTQLFLSTTDSSSSSDLYDGSLFLQRTALSYADLLQGRTLARQVVDRLDLPMSPEALSGEITAALVPESSLLDVFVTDRSPQQAARIAEAVGVEFARMLQQLDQPGANGSSRVKVTVTRGPEIPTVPSSPLVRRNIAIGALAGLLLGVALVFLRTGMDSSVKDAREAAELAAAPVVGTILRDRRLVRSGGGHRGVSGRTAESYRQVRNNLQLLDDRMPRQAIAVCGALPGEGVTTVVQNLARALTDAGRTVAVVNAHPMRSPGADGAGPADVLPGADDVDDAAQRPAVSTYSIAQAGEPAASAAELLASGRVRSLVERLRQEHDVVLIDAPPLLTAADASALATLGDGVLLTVRYGRTRADQLQAAASILQTVGANTIGVVLNLVPSNSDTARAWAPSRGRARSLVEHLLTAPLRSGRPA